MVCLADGVVGVSFGALAVAGGLPLWRPVAMAPAVFAGAAQLNLAAVVTALGLGACAFRLTGPLLHGRVELSVRVQQLLSASAAVLLIALPESAAGGRHSDEPDESPSASSSRSRP